jgi:hypothetical protein
MSDTAARERANNTEAGTDVSGLRVPFSADGSRRAVRARGALVKLIAAKLTLDLLFVCGLAIYTHAVTFKRGFDGDIEHADGLRVSGWVVDLERPGAAVELQLFLNGRFAAATVASEPMSDNVAGSTAEQDQRAFIFQFERPRYGEFEARVYAVRERRGGTRRTLQQIGDPRGFIFK